MKKIKQILPISLLLIGGLTGCSSNTSTDDYSNLTGNDLIIHKNLDLIKKGFTMVGEVHQNRAVVYDYDAYTGDYTIDETTRETNEYNVEYAFDSKDLEAVYRYSWAYYENEPQTLEDITYYEDEEGYIYRSSLNYKNEIDKTYFTSSYGDKVPFAGYGLINAFKLFDYSDITYDENNEWFSLNTNKASILCNDFFYSLNSGLFGVPKYAYFKTNEEGTDFETLYIEMQSRLAYDTDSSGTQTVLYEYNNEVEVKLSKLGETTVEGTTPIEENTQNAPLKTALSKINDNYTLRVSDESTSGTDGATTTSYKKYFFNGTNVFVKSWGGSIGGNETDRGNFDYLLKPNKDTNLMVSYKYDETSKSFVEGTTTYFPSLYQNKYLYSEILPIISEVSSDLFTYDSTKDEYVNKTGSGIISTLTSNCFLPTQAAFRNANAKNAYQIGIRVDENNDIEYIKLRFSYVSGTTALTNSGTVTLNFSDVGTTVIEEAK